MSHLNELSLIAAMVIGALGLLAERKPALANRVGAGFFSAVFHTLYFGFGITISIAITAAWLAGVLFAAWWIFTALVALS